MFFFRKASTRLAAAGGLITLLVLAATALVAREVTHRIMFSDLDDELQTLSVAIASDLELRGPSELPHEALRTGVEANILVYRLEHHSAVLFDPRGVIAETGDLTRHAGLPQLLPFTGHSEAPFTAREPFTGQKRLCRFRVVHLGGRSAGMTLLVLRSIEAMSRTLTTVDIALTLLVLAGAGAAAFVLTVAVRRALSPVEEITAFTERITVRDLSQRVAVPAAGEEFHRLGDVINSLLERLNLSFEAQRRLVSDAAHELKTPTAVISAEAQELARGRLSPAETAESLEIVARAAAGLAREVDDLLELARGDTAAPRQRESFEVDDAIDEAVASSGTLAREHRIRVERHGRADCALWGDRPAVIRAVANLVVNAIRYSPQGRDVDVYVSSAPDACTIEVADRGPGVPSEERRRIFERFVRLPAARKEHPEGSGLGLAIVDQVVRAHGGNVEVGDREGGGAVFRVRFPRA